MLGIINGANVMVRAQHTSKCDNKSALHAHMGLAAGRRLKKPRATEGQLRGTCQLEAARTKYVASYFQFLAGFDDHKPVSI